MEDICLCKEQSSLSKKLSIIACLNHRNPLSGAKLKDFENFLEVYADRIVQKWVDYFVYHKDVKFERISKLK